MPERELQSQLQQLHQQLTQAEKLTEAERASLQALAQDITARLTQEPSTETHQPLIDELSLAVERFEADHPNVTVTLRSIIQTLMNIGI